MLTSINETDVAADTRVSRMDCHYKWDTSGVTGQAAIERDKQPSSRTAEPEGKGEVKGAADGEEHTINRNTPGEKIISRWVSKVCLESKS